MTAQPNVDRTSLSDAADSAHAGALTAMDEGRHLEAVVWLSAHLAAMQRSVHRSARHTNGLVSLRVADHALEVLLRRTEQHYAGDSLAAQIDETGLDTALREALERHCRAEGEVISELVDAHGSDVLAVLTVAYADALRHAPTRPHPHVPHRGVLGAVAFRLDGWRDKVMDTMDGRHVPAPRELRRTKTPGRWGRYLLGEMER
jgi:hypothetical protein